MNIEECIKTRRSIRQFESGSLSEQEIKDILSLAVLAPAPHHTKPWRFVVVSEEKRSKFADAMGAKWRLDLLKDDIEEDTIAKLLLKSKEKIIAAPTLIIGCIDKASLRHYDDASKDNYEMIMSHHSFGAALQNILLVANQRNLAAYWISSPLYASQESQEVLNYPIAWKAVAAIALGRHKNNFEPPKRQQVPINKYLHWAS
jgi:F420 biosynthesis protein FbiB-like protein